MAGAMGAMGGEGDPAEFMGMINDPNMLAMAENMMRDPSFMQVRRWTTGRWGKGDEKLGKGGGEWRSGNVWEWE